MKLKIGDTVQASHGSDSGDVHEQEFTVVGILNATGTPNDRAAFINMEGFYLLEQHAAPERDEDSGLDKPKNAANTQDQVHEGSQLKRLAIDKREVTAILVRSNFAVGIQKPINKTPFAQAVSPVSEIFALLQIYVEPVQWALLILTLLVCVVSAISILVSIYNSMNERTRDIAVMRALGASRDTVLAVILCESCLIACVGGLLGWIGGHAIAAMASPMIEGRTGVKISFWSIHYPNELWVIPSLVIVGILAGLIPALVAYRTDVSKSL
jgi:putative ABC transport system permease protein